ncbi:hypothetical protein Vafri_47, partial [Volvox africanus]
MVTPSRRSPIRLLPVVALCAMALLTRGSLAQYFGTIFGRAFTLSRSPPPADAPDTEPITDWLPPAPASIPNGACVAAFDFDGVLRAAPPNARDKNVPAPEAISVIQACKNAGWKIAICSANDSPATMRMVLGQRLDPSTFSSDFFSSPAFQTHNDDKSVTLRNLISFFNTSPQCIMFFDDKGWNKPYAQQTGVLFIH